MGNIERIFEKFDSISKNRKETLQSKLSKKLTSTLIVFLLFISISPFVMSLLLMADWPPVQYESPEVLNLTKKGHQWDVLIGYGKACDDLNCDLSRIDSIESYKAVLPEKKFLLNRYQDGVKIFYRSEIQIPDYLMKLNEPLYLHSLYIWADSYRVFLNEQYVDSGKVGAFQITIPPSQVSLGTIDVLVEADPKGLAFAGIENMGDLVLGPKSQIEPLNDISVTAEKIWPLWGIVPALVLCFVFCLFFIANPKSQESAVFASFLASMVVYFYFTSSYSKGIKTFIYALSDGRLGSSDLIFIISIISNVILGSFSLHYFRVTKHHSVIKLFAQVAFLAIGLVLLCLTDYVSSSLLNDINSIVRSVVILLATSLSFMTYMYLRKRKIKTYRLKATLVFSIAAGLSFGIFLLGLFKVNFLGFNIIGERLNSSMLMFCLSYLTTLEFSHYLSQKEWLNSQFKSFLGANLANELINNPDAMEPREVDVTVLFTDIRSFTSLSEKMPAASIVNVLNSYMEKMIATINAHGGLIDKFAGDSIMASWGIPVQKDSDLHNSILCAVAMRRTLLEFNREAQEKGWPQLKIGMGLHFGTAIAGVIGSKDRKEYTLIGDTINTASRIESETKRWECDILISETVYSKISDKLVVIDCGESSIRGRKQSVRLYQLVGVYDHDGQLQTYIEGMEELGENISGPGILRSHKNSGKIETNVSA